MVSCEKILEKTGTPSAGQPVPVIGLQFGDEYFRSPTSVIGLLVVAPVTTGVGPYGKCRPPGGKIYPDGMLYGTSAKNAPQDKLESEFKTDIACRSRHVCAFPKFRSWVASRWCPSE